MDGSGNDYQFVVAKSPTPASFPGTNKSSSGGDRHQKHIQDRNIHTGHAPVPALETAVVPRPGREAQPSTNGAPKKYFHLIQTG